MSSVQAYCIVQKIALNMFSFVYFVYQTIIKKFVKKKKTPVFIVETKIIRKKIVITKILKNVLDVKE